MSSSKILTGSGLKKLGKAAICLAAGWWFGPSASAQEEIAPLPALNRDRVHIIENTSYCSVGIGSQNLSFRIDGETVYSRQAESLYLPSFNLFDSPFLRVGCSIGRLVVDFSYYENSLRFRNSVTYRGIDYNVVEFKNNNIFAGYSFSLVPHYLYLDLGLGYSQTQYRLDFTSKGSLRDTDSVDLNDSGPFAGINFKLFVTDYLFLHWFNQQAMASENGVWYMNQLGFNFLVRL